MCNLSCVEWILNSQVVNECELSLKILSSHSSTWINCYIHGKNKKCLPLPSQTLKTAELLRQVALQDEYIFHYHRFCVYLISCWDLIILRIALLCVLSWLFSSLTTFEFTFCHSIGGRGRLGCCSETLRRSTSSAQAQQQMKINYFSVCQSIKFFRRWMRIIEWVVDSPLIPLEIKRARFVMISSK